MTVTPKAVEASKRELDIAGTSAPSVPCCMYLVGIGCCRWGFDNMRIKMQLMALGSDDFSQCSKQNTCAMQGFDFLPAFLYNIAANPMMR